MHALLSVIAEDLRAYANGDLPLTPDALRRLASTLDDIHQAIKCGGDERAAPAEVTGLSAEFTPAPSGTR